MKDCLLVLSGGVDSVTMLYDYQARIALAVSFDYGANHNAKELPLARWHCEQLNIEWLSIALPFVSKYFDSALLSGSDAIPDGHYAAENMHDTVVPFRNGIMLAIAAGIAESRHLKHVMLANHAGDHHIYPDCTPQFVNAMSGAINAGTYERITLDAPYTMLTKTQIAQRGKTLNIDYARTWSCYKGGEKHCGTCATCLERKEAFQQAGIHDNTEYEN